MQLAVEARSLIFETRYFMCNEVLPLEAHFHYRPFSELIPALKEERKQVKTSFHCGRRRFLRNTAGSGGAISPRGRRQKHESN